MSHGLAAGADIRMLRIWPDGDAPSPFSQPSAANVRFQ